MSYKCLIIGATDTQNGPGASRQTTPGPPGQREEPPMTTSTTIPEPATTDSREGRGLALYRERGDEIEHVRGSIWSVPSCTRPGVYLVDLRAGICTCGDMPPAGEVCKHETAATLARAKSGVCSGCGLRFRHRDL